MIKDLCCQAGTKALGTRYRPGVSAATGRVRGITWYRIGYRIVIRMDDACLFFNKLIIKQMEQQTGYLGCDVSKGYCDFILLDSNKQVLEPVFMLEDTKIGWKKLSELIEKWRTSGITQLYCGLESTGGYENNWFSFLRTLSIKEQVVKVARVNPKAVKSMGEAALVRTITDGVSATNIANYLIHFWDKLDYGKSKSTETGDDFFEARQQFGYVKMLVKQKVQLSNQLEKLVYQYLPQLMIYNRNGVPEWLLRLLVKHPSADSILKSGVLGLSKIKGISVGKAESLINKFSDADKQMSITTLHTISSTAAEILHKVVQIGKEKKFLISQYQQQTEVNLISSICGIGLQSAVTIWIEIEDISRFETAKKLCSFFGVHPTFKQSGDGQWGNHLSKKGRPEIRATLYMSCLTAIRHNTTFKGLYARFRAKGMNHYAATGVIMHKMLRIIYGILKSGKPFDAKIDQDNTSRSKEKQTAEQTAKKANAKENKKNRNRYWDNEDNEAPKSRRKYQKDKKATGVPILKNE